MTESASRPVRVGSHAPLVSDAPTENSRGNLGNRALLCLPTGASRLLLKVILLVYGTEL